MSGPSAITMRADVKHRSGWKPYRGLKGCATRGE
jgi:hypothetical protein